MQSSSPPLKPLIQAQNLTLTKGDTLILQDINLKIHHNDFVTIVGPNGAGKSMLLKCLMGLLPITSGILTKQKALKIGYVPQRLLPDYAMPLSVERFLTLRKPTNRMALQKVAQEVGVEDLMGKNLSALSGGQLQRVLLARSLMDSPDLLMLDEPAQNLDVGGQLGFYKLLDRLHKDSGLSILMVSHDLHLVMASTKQVLCLSNSICCSGAPQMVAKDPNFIALFGEDMASMVSAYQHHHKGFSDV